MTLSHKQKELIGDKCVTDELFGDIYLIRIPYEASIPVKELTTWGLTGFYDKEELQRELSNPIVVRSTIPAMAELIDRGHQVSVVNGDDVVSMYKTVRQHLLNWKEVIIEHGSLAMPPFRDLILLDSIAGMLHAQLPPDIPVFKSATSRDIMAGVTLGMFASDDIAPKVAAVNHYVSFTPFFIDQQYRIDEHASRQQRTVYGN